MNKTIAFSSVLLCAAVLAGCGADGGANEVKEETAVGEKERFVFTVTPERPPSAGENGFVLALRDAATDEPVQGATVDVYALMRSMGHDNTTASVVELKGGVYEVQALLLTMPGLWEVRYRASQGAATDEAAFLYDIP